jgi:hypothetical protein
MAANPLPNFSFKEAVEKESAWIKIEVQLSEQDVKNVTRICEGKEPEVDALLWVKVKRG